jgi:pimeloyl-ACP methyl ester carboxylesterase
MASERIDVVERDGLVLDVRDDGPVGADAVVVLLHGWPADSSCWSAVTPRLVGAGLRVVALDQRTVAPGARPSGRRAYRVPELVADVVALLDRLGAARSGGPAVHLVGHDWGGAVAWALAAGPDGDRLASLTVLSTPHPRAMARSLVTSPQLLRSTYVGLFQLPLVPEALLRARDGAVLRAVLRRSGLGAEHTEAYVRRLLEPGALRASLGWYRAVPLSAGGVAGPVAVPTTYVWSTGDTALDRRAAEATADHVTGPYRFVVREDVPHWLPEEDAPAVADLVLAQVDLPAR